MAKFKIVRKSSFLSPGKAQLVFIPSPPADFFFFRGRRGEERRNTEAGGQLVVDLGPRGEGETQAGAGNGRAASAPQARPPAGGGRAAGSHLAGRRGGGSPSGRALGAADRARRAAVVMQPAAPSSALLAGLRPSLRLAGTRISLGLSLPCVSNRKCRAVCNVPPGPRMEE